MESREAAPRPLQGLRQVAIVACAPRPALKAPARGALCRLVIDQAPSMRDKRSSRRCRSLRSQTINLVAAAYV